MLEHVRADLLGAISAIRVGDLRRAAVQFEKATERLNATIDEWEQQP